MRLFRSLFIIGIFFSTTSSFAQFQAGAYAGAYAGVGSPIPGSGMWGGMQACPYMTGAPMGGCATGTCGGESKLDAIQSRLDDLNDDIENFEDEQEELIDGSHEMLGEDRLPFKSGVAKGLAALVEIKASKSRVVCTDEVPSDAQDLMGLLQTSGARIEDYCSTLGETGIINEDKICELGQIYDSNKKFGNNVKNCKRFLDRYDKLEKMIAQAEKKRDKLEDQLYKLEEKQEDAEYKAWDKGGVSPSEGSFCYACAVGRPEPEAPGWKQILAAGSIDLLNAGVWYMGTRYASRNNAKLGYATPPLAFGLPGANATASLFANAYGGGMGAGSWGCAPGMGYPMGPNGVYGSPYGNMSPYGMCGGAFASACGGGGFNVGMGGGIYAPGVGPYGMAGPWGGGGYYPNPYGMGGIGIGAGIGAGIGGGYGNPFGILGGGFYPPGGGMFPGAYGGPYGIAGGGQFGPFGGGYGYGPGAYGMNPYGNGGLGMGGFPGMGIGGGLGGFPGMGGIGGGLGGFPGMGGIGGGLGGFPGMGGGLGGGLGMDYQMQLMNMQMQQYQAYYQAQQRAFQNTQAVTQQIYGLQSEYQQIQQRYQYLMMQLYSGGSIGVGVGDYGTGGQGSYGSGPIPISNAPSTGTGPIPTR